MPNETVILFDGVCNLCTGTVQFLIKRDKGKKLQYASLQGDFGQKILWKNNMNSKEFKSLVLLKNGKVYTRSTAALKVVGELNGLWSLLSLFMIVPPFLRDPVYDWVARNRYQWFGIKEACWIPTPELKALFLD